jgi:hypothetical protein
MNTERPTNKPVTVAVLRSGLVPESVLNELQHWGLPVTFTDERSTPVLNTADDIIECIRDAVESDITVKMRDTDLDVLTIYLKHHFQAHLVFLDVETNKNKRVSCTYAVLPSGNYVIPWNAEDISELLLDPKSFLRDVHGKHIKFENVEELFFGGRKAFISARPVPTEAP